jgi:hypothetical protein
MKDVPLISTIVKERKCGLYRIALLEYDDDPDTRFYRIRGPDDYRIEYMSIDEAKEIAAFINRVN